MYDWPKLKHSTSYLVPIPILGLRKPKKFRSVSTTMNNFNKKRKTILKIKYFFTVKVKSTAMKTAI